MRILVVDDSKAGRTMLVGLLNGLGYKVVSVDTAEEALRLVRDEHFDVVLVDYRVGGMEGIELCWHLRSAQGTRHLYLMLMLPGSQTDQFVEVVENGADEFLRKPIDATWLRARLIAASRVVLMQRELVRLATTDPLTGALNRRRFMDRACEEVVRAQRYGLPLTAVMLDIDHFKRINDTYGHAAGDEAIRTTVRICRTALRRTDVLGRLGGEEFAILYTNTPFDNALLAADRLRETIAASRLPWGEDSVVFTASFGISRVGRSDTGIETVLARADAALYRAKQGGRNRIEADLVSD